MRSLIETLNQNYLRLHRHSDSFVRNLPTDEVLFQRPNHGSSISCGENIVRSAAIVEQTFGGITTRLWDDPYEWTLPEKLYSRLEVANYLDEVEATRKKGFGYFNSDEDLLREIPAPDKLSQILDLLISTLWRSSHYQGRAFAVFADLYGKKPPHV